MVKEDNPTVPVVLDDRVLYRVPAGILEEYAAPGRTRDGHLVDKAVLNVYKPHSGVPVIQDQVLTTTTIDSDIAELYILIPILSSASVPSITFPLPSIYTFEA